MLAALSNQDLARMLRGGAERLRENRDLLSTLDSAIGDGDHGTTIANVANVILETLATEQNAMPQALLEAVGWNVMCVDGGSTSPLLGSFFSGMAEGVDGKDSLDSAALALVFESGIAKLGTCTEAKPGDKTMMDALVPAIAALRSCADKGMPVIDGIAQAAEAARQGAESTKSMQAKFGRARNMGARTIGSVDPGATSISLMFAGFYSALNEDKG